jgi:hypothetical protein
MPLPPGYDAIPRACGGRQWLLRDGLQRAGLRWIGQVRVLHRRQGGRASQHRARRVAIRQALGLRTVTPVSDGHPPALSDLHSRLRPLPHPPK